MGQRQTRQKIEKGMKLYNARRTESAVHEWKRVLSKVKDPELRFDVLGHLARVYGEWGFAREMMHYAVQQMDIASELENDEMKSESYLTLARSNERLCEYHKSLSYARHSLATAITSNASPSQMGYIYLALAASQLGFSSFKDSLENLEKAMKVAQESEDQKLECEVYGGFGNVYKCLKDYDRALKFYVKARELIRCKGQDWPPRLKTHAYLHTAATYRSMRKLDMAMDCGEEAMRLSIHQHDHYAQARCMCVFADVYRNRGDNERAFPRYESALNLMSDIGDRYGQILVLAGMTKALVSMKQPEKAVDFCNKAMEVATSIGNKMCMLRASWTLHTLYRATGDMTSSQQYACRFDQYLQEMELYCGVCHEVMGNKENSLKSLTCFHIFHTRCVENSTFKTGGCPECKNVTSSPRTPMPVLAV